jgi:polyhydroxyalkanoate synthesis regulator phasin
MQEAMRTYLELALGLTEAPRKRVKRVVEDVVGRGGATAEQARALTGDLLAMNLANRKAMAKMIRLEVDRALGKVGLATADEVTELTARVRELERQLRLAETRAATGPAPTDSARAASPSAAAATPTLPEAGSTTPPAGPTAKKTAAKKTAAKKAAAKKTAAKKTGAKKTGANKAPAARTATRKAQP